MAFGRTQYRIQYNRLISFGPKAINTETPNVSEVGIKVWQVGEKINFHK